MTSDGNGKELSDVSPSTEELQGSNGVSTAEGDTEAEQEGAIAAPNDETPNDATSNDAKGDVAAAAEDEKAEDAEAKPEPRKAGKVAMGVRGSKRRADAAGGEETEGEDDDADEDNPVETASLDISEHDPLAPAYDLEEGEPIKPVEEQLPWKSKVRSAKEFFNTEVLYRFDIIEPQYLEPIKGTFRVELKGAQGGVWSFTVGEQLEVVNSREDAETVLSMSQQDFIDIVNGTLNPQLAILSQKVKITGDAKKAILVQELLAPTVE